MDFRKDDYIRAQSEYCYVDKAIWKCGDEELDALSAEALDQINEKGYDTEMRDNNGEIEIRYKYIMLYFKNICTY